MDVNFSGLIKDMDEETIKTNIRNAVETMAFECETEAKKIIITESMDTGQFLGSIHSETFEKDDEFGFTLYDGVKYGIYHEFGTIRHFLPFYDKNKEPILADWAHRVLGMTEEEMEAQGGMMVEINESSPFRKALIHVENEAETIFKDIFSE